MAECNYCDIIKQKKNILYEDDVIVALVPEKQAIQGHIQIITKKHHTNIQAIDNKELEHAFYAASFAATSLFEVMEAHGTNIIANSGSIIKESGHAHIDILARKSGDDLNMIWKPKQLPEEEMKAVQNKIKDKCDLIGKRKPKEVIDLDNKPIEQIGGKKEKDDKISEKDTKNSAEPKKDENTEEKKEKMPDTYDKESYLIKQLRRIP